MRRVFHVISVVNLAYLVFFIIYLIFDILFGSLLGPERTFIATTLFYIGFLALKGIQFGSSWLD